MAVRDSLNIKLTSPGQLPLIVRSFPLDFAGTNMPATSSPLETLEDDGSTAAKPVQYGEWLQLTSSGAKLTRGGLAAASALDATDVLKFPVYSENGRFDEQGLGMRSVIFQGEFEVDSKVILTGDTTTSSGKFGNANCLGKRVVVVQGLMYGDATYAKYSVLGLKDLGSAGLGMTVGIITRPWTSADPYLRVFSRAGGLGCYA